jgi:hypothetical protein
LTDFESPRVQAFYDRVANAIPCVPKKAHAELHAMTRWELLSRYLNWADRLVAPRPRRVITWDGFTRHGTANLHWDAVCALAMEIGAGNDLTPYLSDKVRIGYVPAKDRGKKGRRGVEWADKDYALNAYEMHHLHLNRAGTKELLYVGFSRTEALLLMVGDHKSFDDRSLAKAVGEARVGTSYELKGVGLQNQRTMAEYNQLQRRGIATFFPVGSQTVMGATLTDAGTSSLHTKHAQNMLKAIRKLDPQIDDPRFGHEWFEQSGKTYPASPAFEWALNHCDLCLIESTAFLKWTVVEWRR